MSVPFLTYLDWPTLPEELVGDVYESMQGENFFSDRVTDTTYSIYLAVPRLNDYLKTLFRTYSGDKRFDHDDQCTLGVQKLDGFKRVHRDFSRKVAYNYILELGGNDVKTCFYDHRGNQIAEYVIVPNRWHLINVDILHCLKNLESPRIAITGFPLLTPYERTVRFLKPLGLKE